MRSLKWSPSFRQGHIAMISGVPLTLTLRLCCNDRIGGKNIQENDHDTKISGGQLFCNLHAKIIDVM
jgi:hypothetical protein